MKKSDLIGKLIKIQLEQDPNEDETITMGYIHYLRKLKRILEVGNIDMDVKEVNREQK